MISIYKYRIRTKVETDLLLPAYKGATFRGGFGVIFKKLVCFAKHSECNDCLGKHKCIYKLIFEPCVSKEDTNYFIHNDIPRPFIIEPPLESKRKYLFSEVLEFNLILFGSVNSYLPYFILSLKKLGEIGIGQNRGKYTILEVKDFKNNIIFSISDGIIKNYTNSSVPQEEILFNFNKESENKIAIHFLTPTRIKIKGELVSVPKFVDIIKLLLIRISALIHYYDNSNSCSFDYKELIEKSKLIKIDNSQLLWYDWERFSSRQKTKMKLGGFIGKITYAGKDIDKFIPLLSVGQFTHIGKNCTFGLGQYKLLN